MNYLKIANHAVQTGIQEFTWLVWFETIGMQMGQPQKLTDLLWGLVNCTYLPAHQYIDTFQQRLIEYLAQRLERRKKKMQFRLTIDDRSKDKYKMSPVFVHLKVHLLSLFCFSHKFLTYKSFYMGCTLISDISISDFQVLWWITIKRPWIGILKCM